jgi:hypothetical protein
VIPCFDPVLITNAWFSWCTILYSKHINQLSLLTYGREIGRLTLTNVCCTFKTLQMIIPVNELIEIDKGTFISAQKENEGVNE